MKKIQGYNHIVLTKPEATYSKKPSWTPLDIFKFSTKEGQNIVITFQKKIETVKQVI